MPSVQVTASAENTFTDEIHAPSEQRLSVSVSGTFSATVTVQRKLDGENWRDYTTYTSASEATYHADEDCQLRIGIKTGDYTSGSAVCRLGRN